LWRADHWYNKPVKRKGRPSKEDYSYYMTHNASVTTSGNYSTKALKYCIDVLGEERCMYSIGKCSTGCFQSTEADVHAL